jgi:hypothetical protein
MWRVCVVALLLLATPVWAEESATAYEALRVVGTQFGRGALHQIVSVTGTMGEPQPEKWKIILEDPEGRGVRKLEIVNGKIDSDDRADPNVAGSTEGAAIDVSSLNLDSSGAYAVASHTAEASHINFATADYTLRTDDRGEPTWIVTLRTRSPVRPWKTSRAIMIRETAVASSRIRKERSSMPSIGPRKKREACLKE